MIHSLSIYINWVVHGKGSFIAQVSRSAPCRCGRFECARPTERNTCRDRIQVAFHRFSETIENYQGIAQELRGDALVAEFERASDAVAAALSYQAANAEFNASLEDDIQPQIRIGISLGEVVIADNTITCAGVVLAQQSDIN